MIKKEERLKTTNLQSYIYKEHYNEHLNTSHSLFEPQITQK